jgi:predicted CoA-binding protein
MQLISEILNKSKVIAVIGIKSDESEDAYKTPYYMHLHGYKIIPVNPKLAGQELFGSAAVGIVNEIKEKVDTVNVFRKPEYLVGHAKEILLMKPLPKYVWFQLGIYNNEAAGMLEEKGIKVVQNRCIMVEHANS